MTRPISVSVVAWAIIALNFLGIFLLVRASVLVPLTGGQIAYGYLGLAVAIVSGIFILTGKNWARWLYVLWCTMGLAYALTTLPDPLPLIPGALKTAIIAFVLFRKPANLFFSRGSATAVVGP
jgi:hypothetical protein